MNTGSAKKYSHLHSRPDSHCNCIMCGSHNPASLGIQFVPDETGGVSARFKGNSFLQGYTGILHGGVISSILDAAMTHCLFHNGIEAVTADLHVQFKSSIPFDADVIVEAFIKSNDRVIYRMESSILLNGTAMASGNARFMKPTTSI